MRKLLKIINWYIGFLCLAVAIAIMIPLNTKTTQRLAHTLSVFELRRQAVIQEQNSPRRIWIGPCYASFLADQDTTPHAHNLSLYDSWAQGFSRMLTPIIRPKDQIFFVFSILDIQQIHKKPRLHTSWLGRRCLILKYRFRDYFLAPRVIKYPISTAADKISILESAGLKLTDYPALDMEQTIRNIESFQEPLSKETIRDFFDVFAWHPNTIWIVQPTMEFSPVTPNNAFSEALNNFIASENQLLANLPQNSLVLDPRAFQSHQTDTWHLNPIGETLAFSMLQVHFPPISQRAQYPYASLFPSPTGL